jgi:hypothetical protein
MPKTNSAGKPVHSFRISGESMSQLLAMASVMGRSEADVVEIALDRMYREEIRFNRALRDGEIAENQYRVDKNGEGENESDRTAS